MAESDRLVLLPNTLYFDPLMTAIRGAKRRIQISMYLFKTVYVHRTRANDVADALIEAARDRGVLVEIVLDNGRWEPDVARANWATAQTLTAGGVHVRMGPNNEVWHQKIVLIDETVAFAGSHNFTRGGLTDNIELSARTDLRVVVDRMKRTLADCWAQAYPLNKATPPPPIGPPVEISLITVDTIGDRVVATFDAQHTETVEAFAVVAGPTASTIGAVIGPTVPPTERTAWVRSPAERGQWVRVAVRAYSSGEPLATSDVIGFLYEGTPLPPGSDDEDESEMDEGAAETPPSSPPTAPNLYEATQVTDTTVRLRWAFAGLANFRRFVIEQRDESGNWQHVATLREATAREWIGPPLAMDALQPLRVVVFNMNEESTASEERGMG